MTADTLTPDTLMRPRDGLRRWIGVSLRVAVLTALLTAATTDLLLYAGPTRPAYFRGKRVAPGRDFRVSYAYADGPRLASDTDHVSERYFFAARRETALSVRTVGIGTFRLARLAGTNPAAVGSAVGRWAAIMAGVGVLAVAGRRRRSKSPSPAPDSLPVST